MLCTCRLLQRKWRHSIHVRMFWKAHCRIGVPLRTYPRVRALLLASLDQVEPCANLPGSLSYTCDSNARRGNEVTPVRISHYGQPFQGSRGMAGCAASFLPLSRGRALAAPCPARRSAWKSCYPSAGKPYRCVEMKPGYPQLELALTWRFVFGRF
jgi:hypothetical protein